MPSRLPLPGSRPSRKPLPGRGTAVEAVAMGIADSHGSAPTLLALRALKLGDLLVAVPAIRGLRRAFPGHRLVLAAPPWLDPVVRLIGGVDELLPVPGLDDPPPPAAGAVDVAVNLHGSGPESRRWIDALAARESIVHRVPQLDGAGADPRMPDWLPELHERVRWTRLLACFGIPADPADVGLTAPPLPTPDAGATVVHVGAFHGSRRWSAARFAAVAAALAGDGHRVVFTGSAAERPRALRIASAAGLPVRSVLAGRTDLTELAGLIARARLVVSADTGAAHLASAYARPSVILFGPAAPENWGPPPGPHVVLTHAELRRGDPFAAQPDPALRTISVGEVLEGVRTALRMGESVQAASAAGRSASSSRSTSRE